ncbi:uncharacterized protein LOC101703473 isoform X3 [Heterocephalus glaber]|uniref:Uncharacterized protein LOC101703473 isoform X3 n=1 Tax=Heterocephalus glaber TaxID=10181 RepID=A0AAX6RYJ7_HETGA|nr:uncharacterized protein LOC101703473 isoform X3 [Heterocephalus glaber]
MNCSWAPGQTAPVDTVYQLFWFDPNDAEAECLHYSLDSKGLRVGCHFTQLGREPKTLGNSFFLVHGTSGEATIPFLDAPPFVAFLIGETIAACFSLSCFRPGAVCGGKSPRGQEERPPVSLGSHEGQEDQPGAVGTPVIPALARLRQEDLPELEASLGHVVSSRPGWAAQRARFCLGTAEEASLGPGVLGAGSFPSPRPRPLPPVRVPVCAGDREVEPSRQRLGRPRGPGPRRVLAGTTRRGGSSRARAPCTASWTSAGGPGPGLRQPHPGPGAGPGGGGGGGRVHRGAHGRLQKVRAAAAAPPASAPREGRAEGHLQVGAGGHHERG